MRLPSGVWNLAAVAGMVCVLSSTGCGSGGSGWDVITSPYGFVGLSGTSTGPTSTGTVSGGQLGQADRTASDPCAESLSRKFVTISMRNQNDFDYVHYFFVAIAFVDVDQTDENVTIPQFDNTEFPDGAVCESDIALYTQSGYQSIGAGVRQAFGDYCITGPALLYYHQNGQFRVSAGTGNSGLGSAIAPAQGTLPTYDPFFTSAGAQLPVPDIILFHNPGRGEGGALKISVPNDAPCDPATIALSADPECERDAFYYVGEDDFMSGTRELGVGSGRRVPNEIQGTGCECNPLSGPYQQLAPSGVTAASSRCDEFLRGGRILYAFVRDDETPAFPQLLWRVTDAAGSEAHDFDSRSNLSGG